MSGSGGDWSLPPRRLRLSEGEIHVWRAGLDEPLPPAGSPVAHLSGDEEVRARGFRFERDRRRFVRARSTLRSLLGRYLDVEPAAIAFRYSSYGKPSVAAPPGRPAYFNLAHAGGLALYAFCPSAEVGIDLEPLRPIPEAAQIAGRHFTPRECSILDSLPPEQVAKAFLLGWTRKEACLKALGLGLSASLDACEVTLAPGGQARLLRIAGEPGGPPSWTLRDLRPAPGFVGACAAPGRGWSLRTFCWPASGDPPTARTENLSRRHTLDV